MIRGSEENRVKRDIKSIVLLTRLPLILYHDSIKHRNTETRKYTKNKNNLEKNKDRMLCSRSKTVFVLFSFLLVATGISIAGKKERKEKIIQ